MSLYTLDSLQCTRTGVGTVLSNVGLRMDAGEFVALCGLNGSGKSTLLETMSGLLAGYTGSCSFEGRELRQWGPRELAKKISFLPQSAEPGARFTGLEIVQMGRYPFGAGWGGSDADAQVCKRAMQLADCTDLASRYANQLSGGERQRILFAAVLAQEPKALLLDEPGTFVDLPHQIRMFRTLRELCLQQGMLCVAATHDLNLAAAFCSRIVLLDQGRVVSDAAPNKVLPSDEFRTVFGDHVRVRQNEAGAVRIHYEI